MSADHQTLIAEALAGHVWHHTATTHCSCGWRSPLAQLAVADYLAHAAAALLDSPEFAAVLADVRAGALRNAADGALEHFGTWGGAGWADWLRDRADNIRADERTSHE